MKIRYDFVTNSSSSSFIVLGRRVKLKEIDLNDGKYLFVGKYLSDGLDVLEINEEILSYLKTHISESYGDEFIGEYYVSFIKSYLTKYVDDDDCSFTINEIKQYVKDDEPIEAISLEKDYHCSENVEDLRNNY